MNYKTLSTLASISLIAALGCETQDDNNIEKARQCLNTAATLSITDANTAATIAQTSCEPLIANITTAQAGSVGVGIVLVEEKKLSKLTTVANAINHGTGAVATSVTYLIFASQTNVTNIGRYATQSGDTNAMELASTISLANYISTAAGGLNENSTPAQVATGLTNLAADPTNGPGAAAALLSAQSNACAGSGSSSTLCSDLTRAIGSNTSSYSAILTSAAAYVTGGG